MKSKLSFHIKVLSIYFVILLLLGLLIKYILFVQKHINFNFSNIPKYQIVQIDNIASQDAAWTFFIKQCKNNNNFDIIKFFKNNAIPEEIQKKALYMCIKDYELHLAIINTIQSARIDDWQSFNDEKLKRLLNNAKESEGWDIDVDSLDLSKLRKSNKVFSSILSIDLNKIDTLLSEDNTITDNCSIEIFYDHLELLNHTLIIARGIKDEIFMTIYCFWGIWGVYLLVICTFMIINKIKLSIDDKKLHKLEVSSIFSEETLLDVIGETEKIIEQKYLTGVAQQYAKKPLMDILENNKLSKQEKIETIKGKFLFEKQFQQYLIEAQEDDIHAQYELGNCYYNGYGSEKSLNEAVKWWRKSAEQGHATAQFNLGICYENGDGVAKDLTEALKWYRKAAEQGNAKAQNILERLGETW